MIKLFGAEVKRSAGAGKIQLPPGFVDDDRYGVGQIHTAAVGQHGNAQHLLRRQGFAHGGGQAAGFRAKE